MFDYEKVGGSPLLGVRGHGHHHPRPGEAADDRRSPARSPRRRPGPGVPALIAEALARSRRRRARSPAVGGVMNGPELTVGRGVIAELVRLAAFEVPGRRPRRPGRAGLAPAAWAAGGLGPDPRRPRPRPAVGRRPAGPAARRRSPPRSGRPWRRPSSACSASTSGRSPCWSMASGADRVRGRRTGRRLALAAVFEADFGQRTADAVLERHLAEEERDENAADAGPRAGRRGDRASRRDRRGDHPAGAAVPGHRARPDGPRAAPFRHIRGATLGHAGPGGHRRVGRAGTHLQWRARCDAS